MRTNLAYKDETCNIHPSEMFSVKPNPTKPPIKVYICYPDDSTQLCVSRLGMKEVMSPEQSDIIWFTGGGDDIHPKYYNRKNKGSRASNYPQKRTEEEIELYRKYTNSKKFVGVCRGFQLLNILKGGTLIQHVDNHYTEHLIYPPNRHDSMNPLGMVNSLHHQAIGETFGVSLAISRDAIIEAMAWDNCFGVQWHPEYTYPGNFGFEYFKQLMEQFIL